MVVKVNDFFCGAGGMGLGFKIAGFDIAGAWDFDKYAVESYKANIGDHVLQADISDMTAGDVPRADVWTFGFPCQDLSVSGKKAGLYEGERSKLFFEVMRLIDEMRECDPGNLPKILMAENVKGLKQYLPILKEEYNKRGYRMTFTLYNSKYWGVPQNRERYFVVGIREDIKKAFQFPRQQTEYIPKLAGVLEKEVDEKYYIESRNAEIIINKAKEKLKFRDLAEKKVKCFAMRGRYTETGATEQKVEFRKDEVTSTLTGVQKDNMVASIIDNKQVDKVRLYQETAPTLLANDYKEPKQTTDFVRVRKLTPREYARLQGFPDDYEQVVSNSQFYKQMGNAVTVNVAQAIAEHIKAFLEGAPYPEGRQEVNFPPAAVR